MGAHEKLESFLQLSPRWKLIIVGTFIVLVIASIIGIYLYGKSVGKSNINQRIQQELDDSIVREQGIRAEAEQLAGQNDLLRSQNQAQADLLIESESKRNKESAEKLKEIFDRHQQKINEIETERDVKNAVRSLCQEVKETGRQLSREFCSQAN